MNAFGCTIDVANVDETIAAATKAGGTLAVPKMLIDGVGRLAYLSDRRSAGTG